MIQIQVDDKVVVLRGTEADEAAFRAYVKKHRTVRINVVPSEGQEGVPNRSKTETGATGAAQPSSAFGAVIETIGTIFGIAGAFLLAMPMLPGWGFGAFLVSNVCWLVFSSGHRHWSLFAQQCVFLVSSLVGLWNWWLGPLLLG